MKFILASSSRYRAKLLSRLGIAAETIAPKIDETRQTSESAQALSYRLAAQKALEVKRMISLENRDPEDLLIIAADQTAECQTEILGKPLTIARAEAQLRNMSGQRATFYSSISMIRISKSPDTLGQTETFEFTDVTEVQFRPLSETEIKRYIQREMPLDCAGSFKCEGLGISLFESIQSSDPTGLIGLPLIAINRGLIKLGFNPLLER